MSPILDYGLESREVLFTRICRKRSFDTEEEDLNGAVQILRLHILDCRYLTGTNIGQRVGGLDLSSYVRSAWGSSH